MTRIPRLVVIAFTLAALGAGCFERTPAATPISPNDFGAALESATGTFGEAATTTDAMAAEAHRWDTTGMPELHVGFEAPEGFWVYQSDLYGDYSLVPGAVPEPGSEDPSERVMAKRAASFQGIQRDAVSFPDWERFTITSAQFICVSGTTDEDFILCLDEKLQVTSGKTEGGLSYEKFALQAVRKMDQAPRGLRTYVIVRLGDSSDHGVIFNVLDAAHVASTVKLAKSMRIVTPGAE